jgi:hypothetical protein
MAADCPSANAPGGLAVTMPPRLLRAWRATDYRVDTVAVRIGRRSAPMDALLARIGARTGVLLTAWNPLSRVMPEGWNRRMQRRLSERLRRYSSLRAVGSLRNWSEAHLLVAGDKRPLLRLARLFRQRGVVLVARHQTARLALLDWAAREPQEACRNLPSLRVGRVLQRRTAGVRWRFN